MVPTTVRTLASLAVLHSREAVLHAGTAACGCHFRVYSVLRTDPRSGSRWVKGL